MIKVVEQMVDRGDALDDAALAFLGYGSPPPASDWGLLVADGQSYQIAPWLVYCPAIVIVLTVLSINRISRWLRKTN